MRIVSKQVANIYFKSGEYQGTVEATIRVNEKRDFVIDDITIVNGEICVTLIKLEKVEDVPNIKKED